MRLKDKIESVRRECYDQHYVECTGRVNNDRARRLQGWYEALDWVLEDEDLSMELRGALNERSDE